MQVIDNVITAFIDVCQNLHYQWQTNETAIIRHLTCIPLNIAWTFIGNDHMRLLLVESLYTTLKITCEAPNDTWYHV